MIMRRTEEGALKCAFLDLRREDARAVGYHGLVEGFPPKRQGTNSTRSSPPEKPAAGKYHTGVELGHFVDLGGGEVAGVGRFCRGGPRGYRLS